MVTILGAVVPELFPEDQAKSAEYACLIARELEMRPFLLAGKDINVRPICRVAFDTKAQIPRLFPHPVRLSFPGTKLGWDRLCVARIKASLP